MKIKAEDYFECSAKTGEGVNEAFHQIALYATRYQEEQHAKRFSGVRREKAKDFVRQTTKRVSSFLYGKSKNEKP
jgi:hypothetical protein